MRTDSEKNNLPKGKYHLLFSTQARNYEFAWKKQIGAYSGLHAYAADTLADDFKPVNGNGVVLDNGEQLYDVRLVEKQGENEYTAIGWQNLDENGEF
ncbi:MAG: hypothetical protein ABH834_00150, partial [Candidatus Altiarchaeota archaeon]